MNLQGSVDLLKLELAGITTINGKECLVIPVKENDIYVSVDENLKPKAAYLGLSIFERRETGKYGDTHNVKQSFSKEFREKIGVDAVKSKPYIGNFKPLEIRSNQQNPQQQQPTQNAEPKHTPLQEAADDLPF